MNMNKKLAVAIIALPLAFGAAGVYAFGDKDHGKGFGGSHEAGAPRGDMCGMGIDPGLMRVLDLTDEQQDQIKALRDKHKDEKKAEFAAKKTKKDAYQEKLDALVKAKDFDEAAAKTLAADMQKEREQNMEAKRLEGFVQRLEWKHDLFQILTPEQQIVFSALQQSHMGDCADQMKKPPYPPMASK